MIGRIQQTGSQSSMSTTRRVSSENLASSFHKMVQSMFTWIVSLRDIRHVTNKGNWLLASGETEVKDVLRILALKPTRDLLESFSKRISSSLSE